MIARYLFPQTTRERSIMTGFLIAGVLTGTVAFYGGQTAVELATAPKYQRSLPIAGQVDLATFRARSAHIRLAVAHTADTGNWVRIPSLNVNIPLVLASSFTETDVLRALQAGVVRYPNGVEPGTRGVVVIAGHSTGEPWKGRYRFAFLHAKNLRPGDVIYLDQNNIRYTYRVTGQRLINPRTAPYLNTDAPTPKLALVSCWPLWTSSQRLVVDAELAEVSSLVMARKVSPLTGSKATE